MNQLNLDVKFNENLRDFPLNRHDFSAALSGFEEELKATSDKKSQIKLLGKIGNFQRILGQLNEAEISFNSAILLSTEIENQSLKLANMIRLGNTKHWKNEFSKAHQIFDDCLTLLSEENSLENYRDFIYQHQGKCFFDQEEYDKALNKFFRALLIRNKKSDLELIESTLLAIEETKKRWLPQVSEIEALTLLQSELMPKYVKETLGKKHGRELPELKLNCMNAALNFHYPGPDREVSIRPIEFLGFLMKNTEQLQNLADFNFGDLMVLWNRSGGSWDNRAISLNEMELLSSDFPYGLIFDHVAVRVSEDIVFHKPNPSMESAYKFDYLTTATYPSKLGKGHEVTLHRILKN